MQLRLFLCSVCIFLLFALQAQQTILIRNISIVDVEKGKLISNQHVIIKDSVITAIFNGKKIVTTKVDTIIDGTGRYLIPGLWDMHTHTWNEGTTFPLLIANGVTGIRGMFEDMGNVKRWRQQMNNGKITGPQVFAAGPIVDGPKPIWPGSVAVKDAATGRAAVDSLKNKLHTDFIKVYSLLSRESYFAIAEESKKQQIPFAGHVPNEVTVVEAAKAGQKSQEHLYGFIELAGDSAVHWFNYQQGKIKDSSFSTRSKRKDFLFRTYNEQKLKLLLKEIKKTNTWICPTLTVNRGIAYVNDTSLLNDDRMPYVGKFMRDFWDYRKDVRFKSWTDKDFEQSKQEFEMKLKIVGLMHKAGIPIIAGTDYPNPHCYPGFSIHDEMGWLVKAGLSPAEALKTATYNPAKYLQQTEKNGTVAVNKYASLVILSKNPLQDISHTKTIEMVMVKGKVFTAPQLQQMLDAVKKLVAATQQQPQYTGMHTDED